MSQDHPTRTSFAVSLPSVALAAAWLLLASLAGPAGAQGQTELQDLERLAERAFIQDDRDTAAALYRQLAAQHTDTEQKIRALLTAASIEFDLERRGTVTETFLEVLSLDPTYRIQPSYYSEEFEALFRDAQVVAVEQRQVRSNNAVAEGVEALGRGDTDEARRRFEESLVLRHDNPEATYNLALVDLRTGRQDEAMSGFQKVVALADARPGAVEPDTLAKALTNAGMVFIQKAYYSDAAETLERAVELDPESASAWSNLGIAQRALGRTRDAAAAFERAYRLAPDDPSAIANLAVSHLDGGTPLQAEALLVEAVVRFPRRGDLWLHLGTAQRQVGRLEDAGRALETALRQDPDGSAGLAANASVELAAVRHRLGDARGCLESAETALRFAPDSVDAMVYKGLSQQTLGDLEGARASLESAGRLAPRRGEIPLNLGTVLFDLGDWDGAEDSFERALELNPDSSTARKNLDSIRDARSRGVLPRRSTKPTSKSAPGQRPQASTPPPVRETPAPSVSVEQSPTETRPTDAASGSSSGGTATRTLAIGIRFSDIDYSSLGLQGLMIEQVKAGTPAARAGLRDGDLVLHVDGRQVTDPEEIATLLGRLRSGTKVPVAFLRDNRPLEVELIVP